MLCLISAGSAETNHLADQIPVRTVLPRFESCLNGLNSRAQNLTRFAVILRKDEIDMKEK